MKIMIRFSDGTSYWLKELESNGLFIAIADLLLTEYKNCKWEFEDPILDGIMEHQGSYAYQIEDNKK